MKGNKMIGMIPFYLLAVILTIALAPQVLTTPGFVSLTVTLIENEKQLSVFPVQIAVQPVAHAAIAGSEDYFYVTGFLPAPASARVGQQFRVSTVNEAGQITGVEAFDPEPVSGSGITEEEIQGCIDDYLQLHPLPAAFYITITGADGNYTANKTMAQVTEAVASGCPVYCIFTGSESGSSCEEVLLPFVCHLEGFAVFGAFLAGMTWTVLFNDSGTMALMQGVVLPEDLPETLPNPSALTFNGAVSGTYDGSSPVTITIPECRGEQGPQGEPGADGFSPTITVSSTYTPTTLPDGTIISKVNGFILRITDVNGTVAKELRYGKDGKDGADGYTPVRGVDYWTEADQESIVQQVISALGTPVFGTVDENNNIILTGELVNGTYTLKYEDAQGNVTEIGTLVQGSSYVNVLPLAVASDNTPFNNGQGWKTGYRLNSSGAEAVADGMEVTGFIPVKYGDIVYMQGVAWDINSGNTSTTYAWLYDSSFTPLSYGLARQIELGEQTLPSNAAVDSNGCLIKFAIDDALFANSKAGNISDAAYLRLNCDSITGDSIITINQPIA